MNHWRSQDFVLRGPENRGAEFETPSGEGNGDGVSPAPANYGVWGSVVSSLSRVQKRILVDFKLEKRIWW